MIENRKEEHIRIAESQSVDARHNFWDDITLVHRSIPEVDFDKIDTSADFFGRKIAYPMIISSMTGGTELAKKINLNLATAAEKFGIPMGLGSMRAALSKKELSDTYSVILERKVPVRLANIGAPQLIEQDKKPLSHSDIEFLMNLIDAHFLIIHFNFLQEMIQPEGDRNAKGVLSAVKEIASSFPVIAKETGAGFSLDDIMDLKDAGVKGIDSGGLGGTSFSAIEYYRAKSSGEMEKAEAGKTFWSWGVPSPVTVKLASQFLPVIGSGGLRNGLDLFKAIRMGASAGGFAKTLLSSADASIEQISEKIGMIIRELKIGMFLTGSSNVKDISRAKMFVRGELKEWMDYYG